MAGYFMLVQVSSV